MNKSEIRKKLLKVRKKNNFKSLKIEFRNVIKILQKDKTSSKIIGGYYPYNYEFDPINILEKFEKMNYQISLPKIKENSQMDFFRWSTKDPLVINKYGIPEPDSKKIIYPSFLLVPLVAFDMQLNRIGYGGGFYDRYIKKNKKKKKILTIGLAYSFQKVREIPIDEHDTKLDFIITDKEN